MERRISRQIQQADNSSQCLVLRVFEILKCYFVRLHTKLRANLNIGGVFCSFCVYPFYFSRILRSGQLLFYN